MGTFHAETVARRLAGIALVAVTDTDARVGRAVGERLGVERVYTDAQHLLADPEVDAVVVAAPARDHAELVVAALAAGKGVFCEKPMATTLDEADRVVAAAQGAGAAVQVGFNRRFASDFAAAREAVVEGRIGSVQLLRSLTRDPGLVDPGRVPPWTIFLETLIHDFDLLGFLNPGAHPVEVFALADALVAPEYKDRGLLDTAMVVVRYDNGAMAVAEASFSAVYGYDVRAEVFGSGGMVRAGDPRLGRTESYTRDGAVHATAHRDTELLHQAYVAELAAFAEAVRDGTPSPVGPEEARAALVVALASIESVRSGAPVRIEEQPAAGRAPRSGGA
jgi:myo-inositol 2-dehydrogenase/D-chiro-inositol 1-dehydrogenase